MARKDRWYYKLAEGITPIEGSDGIYYREPWVIAVNFLLKLFQPFTHNVLIVCAVTEEDNGHPHWTGYRLIRYYFQDGYIDRLKLALLSYRVMERYYKEDA